MLAPTRTPHCGRSAVRTTTSRSALARAPPPRTRAGAKKPGFGDELLDFIQAGRKMRKWYGQEGLMGDGSGGWEGGEDGPATATTATTPPPPRPAAARARSAVAVFGADSPTGEAVMTALILARSPALAAIGGGGAGDAATAAGLAAAWGAYASAGTASGRDGPATAALLAGAAVLVLPDAASAGPGLAAAAAAGVPRAVVLVGGGGGGGGGSGGARGGFLSSLFGGGRDGPAPRSVLERRPPGPTGVRVDAVVVAGGLRDAPGGEAEVAVAGGRGAPPASSSSGSSARPVARGDAASALAAAALLETRDAFWVSLDDAGPGVGPEDWAAVVAGAVDGR